MRRPPYTKEEDMLIRTSSDPVDSIAIQLGRTYRSVYNRIVYLRLAGIRVRPKRRKEHKNKGIKKKQS